MVPVTNFRIYQKRKWFSKILFNKSRFIGRTCPFPFIVAQFSWLFYADATHLSTDSLSGAVPLFLCSCYTRSQGPLIFSRWTLHFVVSFWVIDEPFSQLYCLDCCIFFTHELNDILPLSFVWISHNFRVKVSSLSINNPSVTIHSLWFLWLSHKIPVTLFIVSE